MQGLGTLTASPGRGFQKVGCLCRAGKGLGLGESFAGSGLVISVPLQMKIGEVGMGSAGLALGYF